MNRMKFIDCLEFQNNAPVHKNIRPKIANLYSFIPYRHGNFFFSIKTSAMQFKHQCILIDGFKIAGPKIKTHLKGRFFNQFE